MPEDPPAVHIQNLVKTFRLSSWHKKEVTAVRDVSFQIQAGEVFGLIGPNGSGKSTTMKVLLGLMRPTAGFARVFGRDSINVSIQGDVGYLPENPYFYKHLTGAETIAFYGKLCGLRGAALQERTKELLDLVKLQQAGDRPVAGYSKGMLQRIGLAQALVQWPRLLVLDEPTAGVDPAGSRLIRDLIMDLKSRGITIILSSHLLEQVQEVCDKVGIMSRGKLVREGVLADLIALQDQQEIIIQGATPALMEKLRALISKEEGVREIYAGASRTTLERLYLQETGEPEEEFPEYGKKP